MGIGWDGCWGAGLLVLRGVPFLLLLGILTLSNCSLPHGFCSSMLHPLSERKKRKRERGKEYKKKEKEGEKDCQGVPLHRGGVPPYTAGRCPLTLQGASLHCGEVLP